MKRAWLYSFSLVLILMIQAGCAPPGTLYLNPGRELQSAAPGEQRAPIVLEKFSESFSRDGLVGRHQIGSGEQLLRVKPAVLSGAIDTLLGDALARKNVAFARGSGWDRELAGLQAYKGGADLVIGGEITRFSLKAEVSHFFGL